MGTVTDSSYLTTSDIFIGIDDPGGTTPFAAQLSNFVYTPLADPSINPSAAVATATAQTAARDKTPYRAAIPGYGCDQGSGQWSPLIFSDTATTFACTATGFRLGHTQYIGFIGQEEFYWLDGNFPENYSIAADIDLDGLHLECGMFIVRRVGNAGYFMGICSDSFWDIGHLDSKGQATRLSVGQVSAALHHSVTVTAKGTSITLQIDGAQVGAITTAAADLQTNDVTLAISDTATGIGDVTYSNFVFTPLP